MILLPSCDRREADDRCRDLQRAVAELSLRSPDGRDIPLRVSAGASVFPEDGDTYERLLVRADRRMYRNKAQSKTQQPRCRSASHGDGHIGAQRADVALVSMASILGISFDGIRGQPVAEL